MQFYRRKVLGLADVCGLWIGGLALYDVTVVDVRGRAVGRIPPESPAAEHLYDELRRVLVAEEIRATPAPTVTAPGR